MQNDTKIYVSKKAAEIVDTIEEVEVATVKKMYVCIFIDGSRIDDTSYLQMQKRIAQINKVNRDGIIAAAKKKLDAEAEELKAKIAAAKAKKAAHEAAIAARAAAVTAEATKQTAVDKVNYAESNTKKNVEEKEERRREMKRERDRRYRKNNLETVRQRDREYRRKKRAALKAQAKEIKK